MGAVTRSYPDPRRYSVADDMMRDKHGLPPRPAPKPWGEVKVMALVLACEIPAFVALLVQR